MKSDLQNLVKEFLEYLEVEKGRTKNTVRNYYFYITRFAECAKYPSPQNITMNIIQKFRRFLKKEAAQDGLKKSTQNYHLIALRSFLKYLATRGIHSLSPEKIVLSMVEERKIEILEGITLENFLSTPFQTEEPDIIKFRDKAVLELLFATGIKVSEISNLSKDAIQFKKDEFTIFSKGMRRRALRLTHQSKYWIKKYLEKRKDNSSALFVRHDRAKGAKEPKHLTPRSIQRIVQKHAKLAGLTKHITPQTLRHSFAAHLLEKGTDLKSIQSALGHSSITNTQVYRNAKNKKLKETLKFLKPISKITSRPFG